MVTTSWITVLLASMLSAGSAAAETSGGRPAEPDEAAQVRGNSEFAFDLYGRLRGRDGNVFFSPYSISSALAMTYAGARGQTAAQMATTLHFPCRRPAASEFRGRYRPGQGPLEAPSCTWPTRCGDSRASTSCPTSGDHPGALRRGPRPPGLQSRPEKARGTINTWVEQQTHDKIKELLPRACSRPPRDWC